MEKLQTPVVAGMGGAAVLAALLSIGGGEKKTTPPPPSTPEAKTSIRNDETDKSATPNQDGPWRAVCEEYAPYGFGGKDGKDPSQIPRGYKVVLQPGAADGTTEVNTKPDRQGQTFKITVHKQLVGDLTSCIPPDELSKIHLIIATLPDPNKTEMRLEFDRYVDALEKGAEIRGFHYSGYWFPWRSQQRGDIPRKEDEIEATLLRNEQPGILLFHHDDGSRLFIFVVGETPTSGINRIQMTQALRYRQNLVESYQKATTRCNTSRLSERSVGKGHRAGPLASNAQPDKARSAASPDDTPLTENIRLDASLLIAGPQFSGSFSSLSEVLAQNGYLGASAGKSRSVNIISPSTSSDALIRKFTELCNPDRWCNFISFSVSESATDKTIADYLSHLGYKKEQVAEFVEDQSGFGDAESEASPFGLILTYPRELSAVRALSDQQSEQLAESATKILSLAKTPASVKLSSQDPIERDRPGTYAPEDEATEISNTLEDRVRVIRENNIECIVVSATNTLDLVFLLDYMHDRLPNVRLVADGADELEINHPHFIDLTGTIVVSSFPTVSELVSVNGGTPTPVSFPSDVAAGEFLATANLLQGTTTNNVTHDTLISVAGEKSFESVPFKNGTNGQVFYEGIAVSAKETDKAGGNSDQGVALQIAGQGEPPRSFISFSIAIFALTMIHLFMLLNSELPDTWKRVLESLGFNRRKRHLLKFAYVKPGEIGEIEDFNRTFNLLGLNNQIFLLNLLVLTTNPVILPLQAGFATGLHWIAVGAWVMSILTGIAVLSSLRRFWTYLWATITNDSKPPRDKLILLFFSLLVVGYLVSSIVFLLLWRSSAVAEWPRILTLDNGISPVVPIATILLAWALWAALQLRRVKWIVYRKMDLCPLRSSVQRSPLEQYLCEDMNALHHKIDSPTVGIGRVLFVLCFVGVVSWWQWDSLRGIESYRSSAAGSPIAHVGRVILHIFLPPSFEWWFGIWGLVMLLMTVIQTAYQLREIWLKLSRLLSRLETTPMKCAFERIGKDDRIHIKIWDLGKTALRFDEMSLIIESLLKMGYSSEASAAKRIVETYQHADLEGRQPTQQDRIDLNQALNIRLADSIDQLDQPRRDIDIASFELDRYLALRFVTLIRYVLLQMRNLLWFVIYGYFLGVVAVTFYPFQGGKNLSDLLAVTFVVVLLLMAMLVTGILRNPMLKRLEDTESNIASVFEAFLHLLSVGGLPALALLAWQFPWIGQMAFSWLRPLLTAFH